MLEKRFRQLFTSADEVASSDINDVYDLSIADVQY